MTVERPINVLFLCTGNSARSILAEAILNHIGGDRFRGYSAGSNPTFKINETAMALLDELGYETSGLRSKSWDEFEASDAPEFDIVFTVCDAAAKEACPVWVGHPVTVHWGLPDPAAVSGSDEAIREAFDDTYAMLNDRIHKLIELPVEDMPENDLSNALKSIGQTITKSKDYQ